MESCDRVDVETVGHLIQAFCYECTVFKAYELVGQVLEDGLVPKNASLTNYYLGSVSIKTMKEYLNSFI